MSLPHLTVVTARAYKLSIERREIKQLIIGARKDLVDHSWTNGPRSGSASHLKKYLALLGLLPAASVLAETYRYDDLGRVKTVTNGSLVTSYTYDSTDNCTSVQTAAPNTNRPPVCTDQTINMTGIPPIATATVTLTAAMVLARCSDPDGDAMTVTSPVVPHTFTINAGQTHSDPFTVSDGRGGTGSGTIIWIRP